MFGPPPGWVPVGSFGDVPLAMTIEGTELVVEWRPPVHVNRYDACRGRAGVKSTWVIRTVSGRRATDEEVKTVFSMLEATDAEEVATEEAASDAKGRRWKSAAGWLKPAYNKAN